MTWIYSPHYCDVIMGVTASQITSLMIVYSIIHSGTDQRKHQSSVSLAFVRGIHRWPVNSPHKRPVTRKMFTFDDVIMLSLALFWGDSTGHLRIPIHLRVMWRRFFEGDLFAFSHSNLFNKQSNCRWYVGSLAPKLNSLQWRNPCNLWTTYTCYLSFIVSTTNLFFFHIKPI